MAEQPTQRYTPRALTQFKKDVKLMQRRGRPRAKLRTVIDTLAAGLPLQPHHKDHPLKGEWQGCRDCHIAPDWILIYACVGTELILHRTGTHTDIFG